MILRSPQTILLLGLLALAPWPASGPARALPLSALALVPVLGAQPAAVREGLARRLDPLAPAGTFRLALTLAGRDPRGMDRAWRALNDPRSPGYHRYLTVAQYNARFGPDPAAVAALSAWLRSQGLQPAPWHGGSILDVQGTTGAVAAAFHVRLWRYRYPDLAGHMPARSATRASDGGAGPTMDALFAPDGEPSLPRYLAASVVSIVGLSQGAPAVSAARPVQRSGSPARDGDSYNPSQIADAYDFHPLYRAGYHGEHTRVALVELASYQRSDILAYARHYGFALPTITDYPVDGGAASEGPNAEATVDLELLASAAPGAAIDVYSAPNDGTGASLIDAYSQVANAGDVQALSLAWVTCEPAALALNPGLAGAEHRLFQQMAFTGVTVLSASGDNGAYACGPGHPAVNLPASDPYVLGVGSTSLQLTMRDGNATIAREVAWSCTPQSDPTCTQFGLSGYGSGGGLSVIFRTGDDFGDDLSWQAGPGVHNSASNGARQVPDVAFFGSSGGANGHVYSMYFQSSWLGFSGTSASVQLWAALVLLADQYLLAQGGQLLGQLDPLVYRLGAGGQAYPPYHDITSGDNLLYRATPGWDYVTGWGSPDAWNFVRDVALAANGPAPTSSLSTGTPSPTTVAQATATPTLGLTPIPLSPTATRTPVPACPRAGIGNGGFETGTAACWQVAGGLPPRVTATLHHGGRYSMQLGGAGPKGSAASILSQTFSVPPTPAHPVLHLDYWLERVRPAGCQTCIRAPSLALRDAARHIAIQVTLLPHRDRAWSGLAVPLPAGAVAGTRLTLIVTAPAQPAGASLTLYLDDIYLGP